MGQYSVFLVDFLRTGNWFRYQFGAKIFVIIGFLLVLFAIFILEYILADAFFRLLSYQQEFGVLTARYSFNAGFLFLFLLAVVSGAVAINNILYKPEILRLYVSAPLSSGFLFTSRITQVALHSFWVTVLLLAPPLVAFGRNFSVGSDFLIRCMAVVIIFTLVSLSVSALFTVLVVNRFGRLSMKDILFIFALVILSFLVFMQILFPSSFFLLGHTENFSSFQEKLNQLPISSSFLPTNWLATTIVDSWSFSTLAAFAFAVVFVGATYYSGGKLYLKSWQEVQEGTFLAGKSTAMKATSSHFPSIIPSPFGSLYFNEFLAVFRSPAETFYIAFLTGLLVVIFFVGSKLPGLEDVSGQFADVIHAVFLVGLSYIFMTLSARLIYPLVVREKRTAWFLFSLPLKKEKLLIPKIAFASSLALLSIPVGFFGAYIIGFSQALVFIFTFFLVITVGFVTFTNLFIGTIAPNFAESDNPEAASTSGSGLVAITLSFAFILLAGFLFYSIVIETISPLLALSLLSLTAGIILTFLFIMAERKIHQYNL